MELDKNTLEIDKIWANRIPPNTIQTPEGPIEQEIQVLGIDWSCNLGWGTYQLEFSENGTKIEADSECMDRGDDKTFLKALLNKVIEMVDVIY